MANNLRSPDDWFSAARLMARQKMPYFSTAIMGLVPFKVPHGTLRTMGVSHRAVLIWDPILAELETVENGCWTILHEVGHYLREHHQRCIAAGASEQHKIWNIAGDCEINDDLIAGGAKFSTVKMPDGSTQQDIVMPKTFGLEDGDLVESYYAKLLKQAQKQGGGGGQGKGSKGGDGKANPGAMSPQMGQGGCGSGSGGAPLPQEADIPEGMGKSAVEVKRIQRETAEAIRRAAEKSNGRGTVPGNWLVWANEQLGEARVPWQQKLARICRMAIAFRPGAGDYRYDKPSRRQATYGYGSGAIVLPRLRMPVPRVAVGIDTSGSMGTEELKTGLEETKGVLKAVGADIDFLSCDSEVNGVVKVQNIQQAMKAMKGGGGTDFRPLFDAVGKLKPRPEVFIFVTDGMGPAPEIPPPFKTIWLLTGKGAKAPVTWGEQISMDD